MQWEPDNYYLYILKRSRITKSSLLIEGYFPSNFESANVAMLHLLRGQKINILINFLVECCCNNTKFSSFVLPKRVYNLATYNKIKTPKQKISNWEIFCLMLHTKCCNCKMGGMTKVLILKLCFWKIIYEIAFIILVLLNTKYLWQKFTWKFYVLYTFNVIFNYYMYKL